MSRIAARGGAVRDRRPPTSWGHHRLKAVRQAARSGAIRETLRPDVEVRAARRVAPPDIPADEPHGPRLGRRLGLPRQLGRRAPHRRRHPRQGGQRRPRRRHRGLLPGRRPGRRGLPDQLLRLPEIGRDAGRDRDRAGRRRFDLQPGTDLSRHAGRAPRATPSSSRACRRARTGWRTAPLARGTRAAASAATTTRCASRRPAPNPSGALFCTTLCRMDADCPSGSACLEYQQPLPNNSYAMVGECTPVSMLIPARSARRRAPARRGRGACSSARARPCAPARPAAPSRWGNACTAPAQCRSGECYDRNFSVGSTANRALCSGVCAQQQRLRREPALRASRSSATTAPSTTRSTTSSSGIAAACSR